jgi:hypothetical protein
MLACYNFLSTLTTEVAGFRQNRCLSKTSTSYLIFQTGRDTSVGTKAQMQWSKAVPRSPATLVAGECHLNMFILKPVQGEKLAGLPAEHPAIMVK